MRVEPTSKQKDNIRVCVRVRPLNASERQSGDRRIVDNLDNRVYLKHHKKTKSFSFDEVFDESHSQEQIFLNVGKPLVEQFVNGYNCSVFAYGQTGAGKTFTMQGKLKDSNLKGLMPRSLDYLFFLAEERASKGKKSNEDISNNDIDADIVTVNRQPQCIVKVTLVEIYNEMVFDLLADTKEKKLNLREDIKAGVFLEGVTEEIVGSFYETQRIVERGLKNRHVGATAANAESSRSHSVLTVHFESKLKVGEGRGEEGSVNSFQYSKFNFVDLAGSERQKHSKVRGARLKEGCNINKSLTVLGSVINSLAGKRKNRFVRYRESKLTFLLKNSLGGNSKTIFIANVSPSAMYYVETLSTLLFAQRAKMIKNTAKINQDIRGGDIARLRLELVAAQSDLLQLKEKYKLLEDSQLNVMEMKSVSESLSKDKEVAKGEEVRKEGGQELDKLRVSLKERGMVLERAVKEKYRVLLGAVRECQSRVGIDRQGIFCLG